MVKIEQEISRNCCIVPRGSRNGAMLVPARSLCGAEPWPGRRGLWRRTGAVVPGLSEAVVGGGA